MPFKLNPNSNVTKLVIVVELILVVYLLNTLTVSVYRGYQIDKVIQQFQEDNRRIEEDNRRKSEDYQYFTSPNYIDKIAKQNLGLVDPGEKVIVLSNQNVPASGEVLIDAKAQSNDFVDLENRQKWWFFFFDRNKLMQ